MRAHWPLLFIIVMALVSLYIFHRYQLSPAELVAVSVGNSIALYVGMYTVLLFVGWVLQVDFHLT